MPKGFKKDGSYAGRVFQKGHPAPETAFKKGCISWNKGKTGLYKHSPETIEKIRLSNIGKKGVSLRGRDNPFFGKHHTKEAKAKMSLAKRGKHYPKMSKVAKRRIFSKKTRKKMSDAQKMENNSQWRDGISFEPYGTKFNEGLKEQIRKRDKYRCQECFRHQNELYTKRGKKYKLLIHHIDYNKKNNKSNNLISLCRNCHLQTNFSREDWINYFNNKLNNKIICS